MASCSPTTRQLVQEEFERNLPFARSVAESASDPDDPETVTGIETKPFYLKSEDPYKDGIPGANFTFDYSYGDPQPVQVLAKRSLGEVTLGTASTGGRRRAHRRASGTAASATTRPTSTTAQLRGMVTGTDPGDSVEVWFEGGGAESDHFTYQAVSETGNDVLVVAAEDYTGASPAQAPGPHYLDYYLDALAANGVDADVYDVDARDRTAPDDLGVLSHYDGVIWYTGDDVVTRQAGLGAGNADRLALDEMLEFRAYMNEGGEVAYTGNRRRPAVHGRGRRRHAALRPEGRDRVQPASGRDRPAPLPGPARFRRRGQRRAAVLLRRLSAGWR